MLALEVMQLTLAAIDVRAGLAGSNQALATPKCPTDVGQKTKTTCQNDVLSIYMMFVSVCYDTFINLKVEEVSDESD